MRKELPVAISKSQNASSILIEVVIAVQFRSRFTREADLAYGSAQASSSTEQSASMKKFGKLSENIEKLRHS